MKALVIPADWQEPVRVEEVSNAFGFAKDLIFDGKHGLLDVAVLQPRHDGPENLDISMYFDEEGLYNRPNEINVRAMSLYSAYTGASPISWAVPLVGPYVIVGYEFDEDGEPDRDVPDAVVNMVRSLFSGPHTEVFVF